ESSRPDPDTRPAPVWSDLPPGGGVRTRGAFDRAASRAPGGGASRCTGCGALARSLRRVRRAGGRWRRAGLAGGGFQPAGEEIRARGKARGDVEDLLVIGRVVRGRGHLVQIER